MNSLYNLDSEGAWCGHPETGYNVEMATFPACLDTGRKIELRFFVAATDISPGQELRVHYDLGPA